jgi:hypothetical protein
MDLLCGPAPVKESLIESDDEDMVPEEHQKEEQHQEEQHEEQLDEEIHEEEEINEQKEPTLEFVKV